MAAPERFDRFNDASRDLFIRARTESLRGTGAVDTEHLLRAVVRSTSGTAHTVLEHLGVTPERIETAIAFMDGIGKPPVSTDASGLTAAARAVVENAVAEATQLGSASVGPEHLLLGLCAVSEGRASQALTSLGVTLEHARREVMRVQASRQAGSE